MLKVTAFPVRRPGTGTEELIDYCENQHVPLILSLAPAPAACTRNYIQRDAAAEPRDDVDIITEPAFTDASTYQAWAAAMYVSGSGVGERLP